MGYLSNGHVTDDVTWPWKVKLVIPIRLERNISKTAADRLRSKGPRTIGATLPIAFHKLTVFDSDIDIKNDRQFGL